MTEMEEEILYQVKIEPYIYQAVQVNEYKKLANLEGENTNRSKITGELYETSSYYFIYTRNKENELISKEEFPTIKSMLSEFILRYDPKGEIIKSKCAICLGPMKPFYSNYPNAVCRECEERAVNTDGEKSKFDTLRDYGDNPVFIDGKKCWRRYRFGGYITMLDAYDCKDIFEFYDKTKSLKMEEQNEK